MNIENLKVINDWKFAVGGFNDWLFDSTDFNLIKKISVEPYDKDYQCQIEGDLKGHSIMPLETNTIKILEYHNALIQLKFLSSSTIKNNLVQKDLEEKLVNLIKTSVKITKQIPDIDKYYQKIFLNWYLNQIKDPKTLEELGQNNEDKDYEIIIPDGLELLKKYFGDTLESLLPRTFAFKKSEKKLTRVFKEN